MENNLLNLIIRSREDIIYEGQIRNLSSVNKIGKFDVLGLHANFITLIDDTLLIREAGGGEKQVRVESGILKVTRNMIYIYAGVGQLNPLGE